MTEPLLKLEDGGSHLEVYGGEKGVLLRRWDVLGGDRSVWVAHEDWPRVVAAVDPVAFRREEQ